MHDRSEWIKGKAGPHTIGKKTYKNLTEFTRRCVTCSQPFSIFVTETVATGKADTNNFGLKNCEQHRRMSTGNKTPEDVKALRTQNATMVDELASLYALTKNLNNENAILKQRLSKYELPVALEMAAATPHKMPWE